MIDLNLAVHKILPFDGFGRLIRQLTEAMLVSGKFDVHPYPMEMLEWPSVLQTAAGLDHSRLTMFLCPPDWIEKPAPSRMWLYAMHESSQLPDKWAAIVNSTVEHLIVPCAWVKEVYQGSGVTVPVSVVHPGIDFTEVPILPRVRKGTRPYTFLTLGDRGMRKGWDLTYSAFFQAFRKDDNVSLIVKSNLNSHVPNILRANTSTEHLIGRVRSWPERVDHIRDIFAQADAFVYPSHGDGWAMMPREAAACGLPVIATNYSGMAVDLDQWALPLNDWQLVPAPGDDLPGMWAFPSVEELAERMRWCYLNQEEAHEKGLQAAAWLRAHATWEQSVSTLHEVFIGQARAGQLRRQALKVADTATPISIQTLKEVRDQAHQALEKVNGHAL